MQKKGNKLCKPPPPPQMHNKRQTNREEITRKTAHNLCAINCQNIATDPVVGGFMMWSILGLTYRRMDAVLFSNR